MNYKKIFDYLSSLSPQARCMLLLAGMMFFMAAMPMMAQFSVTGGAVDPTQGAQTIGNFIVDGLWKIAACGVFALLVRAVFALSGGRVMEAIFEICLALVGAGIIGKSIGWTELLTGQTIG